MRTALYVDGFNLYHSALEARPEFRWLDLRALAINALGEDHEIARIRYFTARVKGAGDDQGAPQRQDAYVRALESHCIQLTTHWGRFVQREKWKRLVEPMARSFSPSPDRVRTWHREEKGSDVNLAVHLLNDAWHNRYDCAALVSDDSDLAESLSIVRAMGKQIVLLTPINLQRRGGRDANATDRVPARDLLLHANSCRHLSVKDLASSQLPEIVANPRNGRRYRRPVSWSAAAA